MRLLFFALLLLSVNVLADEFDDYYDHQINSTKELIDIPENEDAILVEAKKKKPPLKAKLNTLRP